MVISLTHKGRTIIDINYTNPLHIPGKWYKVPVKQGMLLILFAIIVITYTSTASADTIFVPDDYANIQLAVANSNVSDTIIVRDGIYNENVDVDKQLTIRSQNGPANCIVTAKDSLDHTFYITGYSVMINGFTVKNATGSSGWTGWKKAGIYVNSNSVNISDCVIEDNRFGIYAYYSNLIILTRNIVRDNKHGIFLFSGLYGTLTHNTLLNNTFGNLDITGTSGNPCWFRQSIDTTNTVNQKPVYYYTGTTGLVLENLDAGHISLVDCTSATLRDCNANRGDGIELIFTNDSLIEGNTVCNNSGCAIQLLYSNRNTIKNNIVNDNSNSGGGIRVQCGVDNRVEDNTLKRNYMAVYVEGGSFPVEMCKNTTIINNLINDNRWCGCMIAVSSENQVINNTIQEIENIGLHFASQSTDNLITGNRIINNSKGIVFWSNSNNSIVYNNYFDNLKNAEEVDSTNIWNTVKTTGPNLIGGPFIGGNYWNDYTGTDGNGDGFGDVAYNITEGAGRDHMPLVPVSTICGDVFSDGEINIVDLQLLLDHIVTGTPVDLCVGDINNNDNVNILDVRLLMGYLNDPAEYPLNCGC